ncbi:hypothetical protein M758_5G039000 [Ceratodon purpureus]|nr:hypothetical protein M758_5G039000 [Ceratodon purpureus]
MARIAQLAAERRFLQIARPLERTGFHNYATKSVAGSVVIYEKVTPLSNSIVPDSPPPSQYDLQRLHDFVNDSKRLVVITGAGTSTECGIPDYRRYYFHILTVSCFDLLNNCNCRYLPIMSAVVVLGI